MGKIPEVLKEALPYLEEVITGLLMVKGEISIPEEETKDLVDLPIDEGLLVWVNAEDDETAKAATYWDKRDVASIGGKIIGAEEEELTDEAKDAFSEFMNQFWGRLRLELTKHEESFNFTQPEMEEITKEDLIMKEYSCFFPVNMKIEESEHTFYFLLSDPLIERLEKMGEAPAEDESPNPLDLLAQPEEPKEAMVKVSSEKLDLILDIELPVAVSLGKCKMRIKDVLKLGPGSLIELDRSADDYVDLVVNGKVIARGEVVVVESNFALRIKEIVSRAERIKGLRK